MTTYALEVRFTGVCHFVPKDGWELDTDERKPVTVLFPKAGTHNAEWQRIEALDKEPLTRHVAFATFDLRHLKGVSGGTDFGPAEGVWYFHGYEVTFENLAGGVAWTYTKTLDDRPNLTVRDYSEHLNDMTWLAPLSRVAKDYYEIDPDEACAKVVLDSGGLTPKVSKEVEWGFKDRLSGRKLRRPLAYEIVWRTEGLSSGYVRMKGSPFGGDAPIHFDLVPRDGEINLKLRCFDERNPLGWTERKIEPEDDEDFRWHYQLLESGKRDKIKEKLKGGHKLPIPEAYEPGGMQKFKGSILNIQGVNCIPGR